MAEATSRTPSETLAAELREAKIPHAPIHTVSEVRDLDAVRTKLTSTRTPDGRTIHLPPAPVDVEGAGPELAPRYGEHTLSVLEEAGVSEEERRTLEAEGIIPESGPS